MKKILALAFVAALVMADTASAGRTVFRQRTVSRGGRNVVAVQAFATPVFVQPQVFVAPASATFVQPQAIFAAPVGFSTFGVQSFGGCGGVQVRAFGGGCW